MSTQDNALTQDDLNDSGLRMFLSVDIAGSTKFKGNRPSIEWVSVYENFFCEFHAFFLRAVKAAHNNNNSSQDLAKQIKLWKMLGDELIFVAKITTESDVGIALLAFYETVFDYQQKIQEKYEALSLKGTAWTAGFPIRNRRVIVGNDRQVEDFIGPDMDIGFRLTKVARTGPIIASMDLVDLLIGRNYQSEFHCVFVGWETMKGVFADKPYPVHWLVHKKTRFSLPPWEEVCCPFAAGFSRWNARRECHDETMKRIEKTREILNHEDKLCLFPPYFYPHKMPDTHKTILEQYKDNMRSELTSKADFGVDDAETSEPTVEV